MEKSFQGVVIMVVDYDDMLFVKKLPSFGKKNSGINREKRFDNNIAKIQDYNFPTMYHSGSIQSLDHLLCCPCPTAATSVGRVSGLVG